MTSRKNLDTVSIVVLIVGVALAISIVLKPSWLRELLVPSTPAAGPYASIEAVLQNAQMGSVAYNAPQEMQVGGTRTVQLLVQPLVTPEELMARITAEAGDVVGAGLLVTPKMKAELRSVRDPEAFGITPLHDDPVQVITEGEPTEWKWYLTPKKSGRQLLLVTVYRLIEYQGEASWRVEKSYEAEIRVHITAGEWLKRLDWKWLAGMLITLVLIPALWKWVDRKRKKKKGI